MSAKFAFNHQGTIYLVGDIPEIKRGKQLNHQDLGIVYENDHFVVAAYDDTHLSQLLIENESWLLNTDSKIDKGYIVKNIINPWVAKAKELYLADESKVKTNRHFIIHQQTIYQLLNNFLVVEIQDFAAFDQEERIIFKQLSKINQAADLVSHVHQMMSEIYQNFNHYERQYYIFNTKTKTYVLDEVAL